MWVRIPRAIPKEVRIGVLMPLEKVDDVTVVWVRVLQLPPILRVAQRQSAPVEGEVDGSNPSASD